VSDVDPELRRGRRCELSGNGAGRQHNIAQNCHQYGNTHVAKHTAETRIVTVDTVSFVSTRDICVVPRIFDSSVIQISLLPVLVCIISVAKHEL